MKQRIGLAIFLLISMASIALQSYNMGYDNAKWHYQDRASSDKIDSDKKWMEVIREIEQNCKKR